MNVAIAMCVACPLSLRDLTSKQTFGIGSIGSFGSFVPGTDSCTAANNYPITSARE
jgi:hypothetical protein